MWIIIDITNMNGVFKTYLVGVALVVPILPVLRLLILLMLIKKYEEPCLVYFIHYSSYNDEILY